MCCSPLRHSTCPVARAFAFDLHVLATPPAFVLSQDQTLHLKVILPAFAGIRSTEVDSGDRPYGRPVLTAPPKRDGQGFRSKPITCRQVTRVLSRRAPRERTQLGSFRPVRRGRDSRTDRPHPRDGNTVHL
jgi:hypothetical protein